MIQPPKDGSPRRSVAFSAGRTTITIAHRLSTAEGANEIFVFDAGRIVERGTHTELVEVGGTYAGLYRSWLGNVRI